MLDVMLQHKMRDLKNHADTLLDNILNHPNLTEPQINRMPAHQKEDLRRRVKSADDVSSWLLTIPLCVQSSEQFMSRTWSSYEAGPLKSVVPLVVKTLVCHYS